MRRIQFFEFHELAGFPKVLRDLVTDFLSSFASLLKPYGVVAELLADAVAQSGAEKIIDLCSGAAAPILTVQHKLDARNKPITVSISDKFPNSAAFAQIERQASGRVTPVYDSIDATSVPEEMRGFRTIFTAFHHFPQKEAREILADAREKGQGIGIFEYTERSPAWVLYLLTIPAVVWICSLGIRPLSWQRLVFTYLIPLIPLFVCFDGAISCLRTYSPAELQALVDEIEADFSAEGERYEWQVGQIRSMYIFRITYLLGCPR